MWRKYRECLHHTQQPAAPGTAARVQTFLLIDKVIIQKITSVYPIVSSTDLFLLFTSVLASIRMLITYSRPTSQGAGCLHMAPPTPHHWPRRPPRTAIRILNSHGGRGYGMVQAIWVVERGGLYLKETSRMEAGSNNRQGYVMRDAATCPSHAGGAQEGVGLVS